MDPIHADGSMVLIEPISSLPDYLFVVCSLGIVENGQVAIQVMNLESTSHLMKQLLERKGM